MLRTILTFTFTSVYFISGFAYPVDTTKFKSFQSLEAEGLIESQIYGTGGYSGNHFRASFTNNTTDSAFVWIEAGRRIFSDDTTIQDIFIAHHEMLALAPEAQDSVDIFGFCCQASFGAPYGNSTFKSGEMAPETWVELAEFLHLNEFPISAIQSAVWVFSDHKPMSSISDADPELIAPLKRKVAELLGIEVPWYTIGLKKIPNQLSSDIVTKIEGLIEFYVSSNGIISILIKDQYGQIVSRPIKEEAHGPGEYTFELKQYVEGWKKGSYTVYVIQDYQYPIKKKTFKI